MSKQVNGGLALCCFDALVISTAKPGPGFSFGGARWDPFRYADRVLLTSSIGQTQGQAGTPQQTQPSPFTFGGSGAGSFANANLK